MRIRNNEKGLQKATTKKTETPGTRYKPESDLLNSNGPEGRTDNP